MKLDAVQCGVAGEYFVAAELSRRGYIASITLRNTRGVDILVSNRDASKSVAIQVKTNQRGAPEWILTEKIEKVLTEQDAPENLYFVFVSLPPNGDPPEYHIISRREVAGEVKAGHELWLATPSRRGQPHSASSIRKFSDPAKRYQNNWSALGLD